MRCRDTQAVKIDQVDVGLVARRQPSAVAETDRARRHIGELLHRPGKRPVLALAIARPVGERVRGVAGIADQS
jgi:hypothetical protein